MGNNRSSNNASKNAGDPPVESKAVTFDGKILSFTSIDSTKKWQLRHVSKRMSVVRIIFFFFCVLKKKKELYVSSLITFVIELWIDEKRQGNLNRIWLREKGEIDLTGSSFDYSCKMAEDSDELKDFVKHVNTLCPSLVFKERPVSPEMQELRRLKMELEQDDSISTSEDPNPDEKGQDQDQEKKKEKQKEKEKRKKEREEKMNRVKKLTLSLAAFMLTDMNGRCNFNLYQPV
ncbi:hypothetical protein RFI_23520 [Reticulomyxa filosa]|uniref:Uncharacterized protein n=1 Tax=Reticulomyxa filosa TaxID=46433 RepID=X6MIL4_RETFI|nr:hypothetical protein RFI_23520 [Reticulomyxa filosa]|eukprot:ETO13848.1 hypothetical protein RFI_23520 [Reticulomyxa filosa]